MFNFCERAFASAYFVSGGLLTYFWRFHESSPVQSTSFQWLVTPGFVTVVLHTWWHREVLNHRQHVPTARAATVVTHAWTKLYTEIVSQFPGVYESGCSCMALTLKRHQPPLWPKFVLSVSSLPLMIHTYIAAQTKSCNCVLQLQLSSSGLPTLSSGN